MRRLILAVITLLVFGGLSIAQSVTDGHAGREVAGYSTMRAMLGGASSNSTNGVVDGAVNADSFPGADIGAQINAAVAYCRGLKITCRIEVNKSGTISTPPELPLGFSLSFNPQGTYRLETNWKIDHRDVSVYFNNARIFYTLDNGKPGIYVGKGLQSVVNTSGTTVTWVSGDKFSTVDVGDTIFVWNGRRAAAANVTAMTPTSLTVGNSLGNLANETAVFYINVMGGTGPYGGQGIALYGLNIAGTTHETNPATSAFTAELVEGLFIDRLQVSTMGNGTCAKFLGALKNNIYGLDCNDSGSGLVIGPNSIGGGVFMGGNANRFYGVGIEDSAYPEGKALSIGGGGNLISGLIVEGNHNRTIASISDAGDSRIQIADWEQNGTTATTDFEILSSNNLTIEGPAQFQSYGRGTAFSISNSANIDLRMIAIAGNYQTAISTSNSSGKLFHVTNHSSGAMGTEGFVVEDANGNYSTDGTIKTPNLASSKPLTPVTVTAYGSAGAMQDVLHLHDETSAAATPRLTFGSAANPLSGAIAVQTASATQGIMKFQVSNGSGPVTRLSILPTGTVAATTAITTPNITIGHSGSTINGEYKGSGTLVFTTIAAQSCQDQVLTISGASVGDTCSASPAGNIGANLSYGGCYISAANTAEIRVCNPAANSATPVAVKWTGWARY